MIKEKKEKLNNYFSRVLKYMTLDNKFYLYEILKISILAEKCNELISLYRLEGNKKEKNLSLDEVYSISKNILYEIDNKLETKFDEMLKDNRIVVSYRNKEEKNNSEYKIEDGKIYFNLISSYSDIPVLIHEFFHSLNVNYSINNSLFTEMISIYFEMYSSDLLVGKGIDKNLVDYKERLIYFDKDIKFLLKFNKYLFSYMKNGEIRNIFDLEEELYEEEIEEIYNYFENRDAECEFLESISNQNEDKLRKDRYLSKEFVLHNKYFLNTLLAIYCKKYLDKNKMLEINEELSDEEKMNKFFPKSLIDNDILNLVETEKYIDALKEYLDSHLERYKNFELKKLDK